MASSTTEFEAEAEAFARASFGEASAAPEAEAEPVRREQVCARDAGGRAHRVRRAPWVVQQHDRACARARVGRGGCSGAPGVGGSHASSRGESGVGVPKALAFTLNLKLSG